MYKSTAYVIAAMTKCNPQTRARISNYKNKKCCKCSAGPAASEERGRSRYFFKFEIVQCEKWFSQAELTLPNCELRISLHSQYLILGLPYELYIMCTYSEDRHESAEYI